MGKNRLAASSGGDSFLVWSPAGDRIAYTGWDPAGWYRNVWSINTDGSDPAQLTFFAVAETHGSYSPDGQKIVCTQYRNDSRTDILVMDADGSNIAPLLSSGHNGGAD